MLSSRHEPKPNHVPRSEEDPLQAIFQEERWPSGFGDASTRSRGSNVFANRKLYQNAAWKEQAQTTFTQVKK